MSLQHQNKNLPKHLQHMRLQKEDDEEPWISGEELHTEGSSDEETSVKDFKKKLRGSTQSSASSLKSRIYSSSSASIKEKSDNDKDPSSSKPLEWRPKREKYNMSSLYEIEAERLDTETKWKSALEELRFNRSLYKDNTDTTSIPPVEMHGIFLDEYPKFDDISLGDDDDDDEDMDDIIPCPDFISDTIITLDKEIENYGSILKVCKQERINYEKNICTQINSLNTSKVTSQSTDKFHKICNYKKERSGKMKKTNLFTSTVKSKIYSRMNKYKFRDPFRMEEFPLTKLNKEQTIRLRDLLTEKDGEESPRYDSCFKHTNEELELIEEINEKLKTLQGKCDDAGLNGKTSKKTVDEGNREWKEYFKVKEEKLRKINVRLKALQNLKSTENKNEPEKTQENKQ